MKKLLSIVLALSLCLTAMMGCFVVSADAANKVTVETVTIKTGTATKDVKVTFDFEDTFAASQFTVNFGDLKLTGISAPEGVAIDHNATADGTEDDFSVLNGSINCILDAKGDATLGAFTDVVVTLTFNTADLAAGTYAITFAGDVASAGTYDGNGWTGDEKMLEYTATAGAIVVEAPCAHAEFTYTNNGDNHTKVCKANCGEFEAVVEDHVYGEDNKCVCGAEKKEEIVKFDFYASNITLGNALVMNFAVEKTLVDGVNDANCYAVVTKEYGDGRENTEKIIPMSEFGKSSKYYTMSSDGIPAKEMGDNILVTIYDSKGNAVSNTKTDSVEKYVLRTFDSQKEIAKPMLVDMLKYGAASQVELDYNTAVLCDAQLTSEQLAYATDAVEMTDNSVKGTSYFASNLSLKSEIQLNIGFKSIPTTVAYAKVTYTGWNGGDPIEKTINAADFTTNGSVVVFKIDTLRVADGCQVVTVDFYDADNNKVESSSDSVESYCARNSKTADDFYATVMKFVSSSYYYLSNK